MGFKDKKNTKWYSNVTLYRQKKPGDWSGVFEIITANNQDASFKIYNILGEKIMSNNSILQPIKIGNLQSGIYLIEVYKNNQSIVKKLIVN